MCLEHAILDPLRRNLGMVVLSLFLSYPTGVAILLLFILTVFSFVTCLSMHLFIRPISDLCDKCYRASTLLLLSSYTCSLLPCALPLRTPDASLSCSEFSQLIRGLTEYISAGQG